MTATHWTGKGDGITWSDPANWSVGTPMGGVDAAFGAIDTGTVNLSRNKSTLSAGALIVRADDVFLAHGLLDLAPEPASSGNTFDLVMSHGANLTIGATARLQGSNVAKIGDSTGATLTVLGTVSEEYGVVSDGTLGVSGPTGHWISGDSGLYFQDSTLSVQNGGRIDTGGKLAQYPAAALEFEGNSTGTVTGCGSSVHLANVFVSDSFGTSSLTVANGGTVYTGGGDIGGNGDGTLTVTGTGSLFSASRGLTIGGQVPVNSKLLIEDGGTVKIGPFGLVLHGTLALDASATFTSPTILSGGGEIDALRGSVALSSRLELFDNDSDPFETKTTYLTAEQGSVLILNGAISSVIPGDTSVTLEAGSGHIVLAHSNRAFAGETSIYGATLEIDAATAAGTGRIEFVGGSKAAELQIDNRLALHNEISGFGKADEIDLAGFAYGVAPLQEHWTANTSGGMLSLTNSAHQHQTLSFIGADLSVKSFTVSSDGNGGVALGHS